MSVMVMNSVKRLENLRLTQTFAFNTVNFVVPGQGLNANLFFVLLEPKSREMSEGG